MANEVPAAWYPDTENAGGERYWDGVSWTDQRRPAPPPPGVPPPPTTAAVAQGQGVVYVEKAGNGIAVGALVCGILGAVIGLIPILAVPALGLGLVALVLGIMAWRRVRQNPAVGHKGSAIAGTILGVIAIALGIAGIAVVDDAVDDLNKGLSSHCLNNPSAPDCP